jgi:hypothetical protein
MLDIPTLWKPRMYGTLSSECGTQKICKAGFWLRVSGEGIITFVICSIFAM